MNMKNVIKMLAVAGLMTAGFAQASVPADLNAAPGVLFDTAPSTVNPAFNDTILPISQTELMDAVIPVVSERLRTTVRPAIIASYDPTTANSPRWRASPRSAPLT